MNTPRSVRCAIYTRKSTEEGLDQAFNSLDAQRESCLAYIKSQAGEGWRLHPPHYDDGGFSGGNMERPALRHLLEDIDHGRVDCVVVYKIDRLTRSLADFAKIVERFEKRNVTFVSVTQSFNTTTSMGRLTLNVLLSFAQFEREVTAERIRDKFAASKAKGIFMGGSPPLGYDARNRKLVVNDKEASAVRFIFARYLGLKSIGSLLMELEQKFIRPKSWISTRGRKMGANRWYTGPLRHILRNPVYVGLTRHKEKLYKGEHQAIIDKDLFERVQAQLDGHSRQYKRSRTIESESLLVGLIFDDKSNRMTPQWSVGQDGRRHNYYVSQALLQRRRQEAGSLPRVAAPLVEGLVLRCLDAVRIKESDQCNCSVPSAGDVIDSEKESPLSNNQLGAERIRAIIKRITIEPQHVVISCLPGTSFDDSKLPSGTTVVSNTDGVHLTIPGRLKHRGGNRRIENWNAHDWTASVPRNDERLLAALVEAHRWKAGIESGDVADLDQLASEVRLHPRRVRERLRLAFLAPDIQRAIIQGRQPKGLTLERLIAIGPPAAWVEQRKRLGLIG